MRNEMITSTADFSKMEVLWGMNQITLKDLPDLDLGDIRRNQRFISIVENLIAKPGNSIARFSNDWYETKATYEFFKCKKFSLDSIIRAVQHYGASTIEEQTVLVLHDTSSFSYNNLEATKGLGYLDNKLGRGILCHNSMAATTSGTPLALLNQIIWTRNPKRLGKSQVRKQKPIKQKESYKWYKGIKTCNELLSNKIKKIHIGDREADIYEIFFMPPDSNAELLIRACQNRTTAEGSALWQYVSRAPQVTTTALTVWDKTMRKKKQINVEVRYRKVEILRPRNKQHEYESIELTAIEVREKSTKDNAILWRLLTTLEVNSIEQVKQCVQWYTHRWLIERFHFVVKSGCKVEELQLKQADSLKKAIATYSFAAFKIMQMTYESRAHPKVSCEVVLTKQEWQTLYMLETRSSKLPQKTPTLAQAVCWIAKLGGYLNRKSDGPPGLITVWLGYHQLTECVKLYSIMSKKNLGKD